MNCVVCGLGMDPALAPATHHPTCVQFAKVGGLDPAATKLKNELIDIIRWADQASPRSQQKMIGPSELGSLCERRIGYRIADVAPVNFSHDPWAAIVGTAVHFWLEKAMLKHMAASGSTDWITEATLQIDDFVIGHSDLYQRSTGTVVDYKTTGPDALKKYRNDGPPPDYVVQVNLYGYGYAKLGYPVRKVALAFYPRAGWLKDSFIWIDDYRPEVAEAALQRLYTIAGRLIELGLPAASHRWEQVDAVPSNTCGFCPWYAPSKTPEEGASDTGCPGR